MWVHLAIFDAVIAAVGLTLAGPAHASAVLVEASSTDTVTRDTLIFAGQLVVVLIVSALIIGPAVIYALKGLDFILERLR